MSTLFPNNKVLSPRKSYDEFSKMVNDKLKESKNETFGAFKETDDALNLPTGTSWEMSGWKDYFDFYDTGEE